VRVLEKQGFIDFWVETAESDYVTMQNLYASKDYHWSLFLGHLVIEKLLKALYIKNIDTDVPRTHDLLRLAENAKLEITEEQKDILDLISTFNISARYPDYKHSFYKKCDYSFTTQNIEKIKELRQWLLSMI
jgi:HEPN domain-containing protein